VSVFDCLDSAWPLFSPTILRVVLKSRGHTCWRRSQACKRVVGETCESYAQTQHSGACGQASPHRIAAVLYRAIAMVPDPNSPNGGAELNYAELS